MTTVLLQVTAASVAGCLLVASFYGYSYTLVDGVCRERAVTTAMKVFMWSTEVAFNLVAPIATIVLNVMVIRRILRSRRARRHELTCTPVQSPAQNAAAAAADQTTSKTTTTLMLLSVSFFYVATTLPMTFVYLVHPSFQRGDDHMTDEQVRSFCAPCWGSGGCCMIDPLSVSRSEIVRGY